MRSDFAVFILTHGRADNVVTVPAIKKAGYTGKIYFIIDDEDEQAEEYKKNFGADRVIIFDKQAAYDRADTMDNFNDHRAIIYARNECWRIAEELGLKYFLMLDDDYKSIDCLSVSFHSFLLFSLFLFSITSKEIKTDKSSNKDY